MRKYYLYIVCVLCSYAASAQYYATQLYAAPEGLYGDVTQILIHSDGSLWCGTYSNGIYHFDNKNFTNYSTKNGMVNDICINLFEDEYHNIWSCNAQQGISYITPRGKIVVVEKSLDNNEVHEIGFKNDKNKLFFSKNRNQFDIYDYAKNAFVADERIFFDEKNYVICYEGNWMLKKKDGYLLYLEDKKTNKKQYYNCSNGKMIPYTTIANDENFKQVFFENNDIAFIRTKRGIYINEKGLWNFKVDFKKIGLENIDFLQNTKHNTRSTFFGKYKNGAYCIVDFTKDFSSYKKYDFKFSGSINEGFTSIVKDKANNFWITTQDGLLKVYSSIFEFKNDAPNMLKELYQLQEDKYGKIWFGSYRNGAAVYDGNSLQPAPKNIQKLGVYYFVGYLKADNGDMIMMSENKGFFRFDGKNKFSTSEIQIAESKELQNTAFYLYKSKKGKIWIGGAGTGLGFLPHEDSILQNRPTKVTFKGTKQGITTGNVLTITEDNYGRFWFGRPSKGIGVYNQNLDKGVTFKRENQILDYGAISSVTDTYGNIWFGTDKGLCFFTPPAEMPDSTYLFRKNMRLVAKEYLGNSQVNFLKIWNNKYLVIGNQLGISIFDLEVFYRSNQQKVVIRLLNKYGATMSGASQNDICIDHNNLIWAATDNGVTRFDPSLFVADTIVPKLYLDSLASGTDIFRLSNETNMRFEPERKDLVFYFHSDFNTLLYDNIQFRYRFATDTAWSELSSKNTFELRSLKSGRYRIEIQAVKDGICSEIRALDFWILPWYLDTKLLGFFGIFCALVVVFGGTLYNKKQAEIENQRKEQNKLQVQAIVNQLNPHFINNALGWVQSQITNDEAQDVIQKLAENIGIVFLNTREKKAFHSLSAEVKLVKNYLVIQKHRFEERVTYILPEDTVLDRLGSTKIPLMLFQIHCENAVEHGIVKQKNGGYLKLLLEEQDKNFLKVVIEDNGIGRRKAAEIGSRGTQQGTKMLKELETIFNKHNEFHLQSWYEDDIFTNEKGEKHGTRVHIVIPKNYIYDI